MSTRGRAPYCDRDTNAVLSAIPYIDNSIFIILLMNSSLLWEALYLKPCAVFKGVAEQARIGETAFGGESLRSWIDCQEKAVVCILATLVSAGRPG